MNEYDYFDRHATEVSPGIFVGSHSRDQHMVKIHDKRVVVYTEMGSSEGIINYYIDAKASDYKWENPNASIPFTEDDMEVALNAIKKLFDDRGDTYEVVNI